MCSRFLPRKKKKKRNGNPKPALISFSKRFKRYGFMDGQTFAQGAHFVVKIWHTYYQGKIRAKKLR
jgi:hypothetical protein